MEPARVFLDTNAISYTADRKVDQRAEARPGKHSSAGKPDRDITLVTQSRDERAAKQTNSSEVELLRDVVELAKAGTLKFHWSHEVQLELLFQPWLRNTFYGEDVECELVRSAADYRSGVQRFPPEEPGCSISPGPMARQYAGALQVATHERAVELLRDYLVRLPDGSGLLHFDFRNLRTSTRATHDVPPNAAGLLLPLMEELKQARYVELLSLLQVGQLSPRKKPNGYLDAFLLWTAELADCTHFLTTDRGIVEKHRHESLKAVFPSQLLAELGRH